MLHVTYSKLGEKFSLKDAYLLHHNPIFCELVTSLYIHRRQLNLMSDNSASVKSTDFSLLLLLKPECKKLSRKHFLCHLMLSLNVKVNPKLIATISTYMQFLF